MADTAAWTVNFALNRVLNFRSHAPVGPQARRYTLVICAELAVSAGATSALAHLGADLVVARIAAGGLVAVIGYAGCRWWVFRHPQACSHQGQKGRPRGVQPSGVQASAESTPIATNTSAR